MSNDDDLVRAVRDAADSPVDKLRTVPLIAEIKGPAAALTELDRLSFPPPPAKAPPEASLAPDVSTSTGHPAGPATQAAGVLTFTRISARQAAIVLVIGLALGLGSR